MRMLNRTFPDSINVLSFADSVCLACYISNGHINIYSLPSLKVLVDVDFLALSDLR